jgi:uncharacterized membrane protein YccC
MRIGAALPRASTLADALNGVRGPLLFGLRMWVSLCLALYVAFWLQLDNPYWAGSAAVIVCQPQLGASLRKAWFLMIGTVVGAVVVVGLTALFPQDRVAFLGFMALWCGICGFAATVLRNFASYSAALSGYTALLIAASVFGATGGPTPDIFLIAIYRASEICIGIACAGVVLAGTDLGGVQQRLAVAFANLVADVADGFTRMLTLGGSQQAKPQAERREIVRRVIALDPMIDQTIGESTHVRYRAPTLQTAVDGLLNALNGWRGVATHLTQAKAGTDPQGVDLILSHVPVELRSAREPGTLARWMTDPMRVRRACGEAVRALVVLPARTPSLRLLADETARVMAGMARAFDGFALLVNAPDQHHASRRGLPSRIADWLPAWINGGRAFATIAAAELLWVVTAWPNGAYATVFVAVVLLLLSPRGDVAYGGAVAGGIGALLAVICGAIIKLGVLPMLQSFPAFALALGLFYIPVGFGLAYSKKPPAIGIFTVMGVFFMLLVQPNNMMTYDPSQYYNLGLSVIVGCIIAPLAFKLWPPLTPAARERRLLSLTLRDLRGLATSPRPPKLEAWQSLTYSRLIALPDQAAPLQRARLLAALSVGSEISHFRRMALETAPEIKAALAAFAEGGSTVALAHLHRLDERLSMILEGTPQFASALATRSRILLLCEALSKHADYFDAAGTP